MNKKQNTILVISVAALLSAFTVGLVFLPQIRSEEEKISRREKVLEEYRGLLARKTGLESEWESKRNNFPNQPPQEILNAWLKELLNDAQSQSLVLDKLEPAGIKEGPGGKETAVFVSFQGDIKKFNAFINHLLETDPLARVQSVSVRQEESAKNLSFELMLAKGVS